MFPPYHVVPGLSGFVSFACVHAVAIFWLKMSVGAMLLLMTSNTSENFTSSPSSFSFPYTAAVLNTAMARPFGIFSQIPLPKLMR